jgi:SAM-dependent methyltransferase
LTITNALFKLVGWRLGLIYGDTLVVDRWRWLSARLPASPQGKRVLDVGCGSGPFSLALAARGYSVLGLDSNPNVVEKATIRAHHCRLPASFVFADGRRLDEHEELKEQFDIVVCCEVIEHIIDDARFLRALATPLKIGGQLLLTTPNYDFRAITPDDDGPYATAETGGHVRRGYRAADLQALCVEAGFSTPTISYCSGLLSQKVTWFMRHANHASTRVAWGMTLPLRILPLLDGAFGAWISWPPFSICVDARRVH